MNKMKSLIMALSLLGLFSCKAGYTNLDLDQFASKVEAYPPVCLVDVRTPEEYAEGHLDGAVLIDFKADGFVEKAEAQLQKDKPVALYCRGGRRSHSAAELLNKAGFKQLVELEGGITAWNEAGKPVE